MATRKRAKAPSARRVARKPARKPARKAVRKKVEAVPKAYGTLTPGLAVRGAADAIAFYSKAFGARELSRMPGPGGSLIHAEIRIGDRIVMLGDESPEMGAPSPQTLNGSPVALMLYVKDVDHAYARAVAAGATPVTPPADMFWGDRYGQVRDPFGHRWSIATRTANLTPAQMKKGLDAFMASMGPQPG
jgi:uncharacterized glyoxalase superfamily protein PhnB